MSESQAPSNRNAWATSSESAPEDCGSIHGYYEFLDDIAGPDKGKGSKRKKQALNWYGGPYDPEEIDEEQIRISLKRIANASRPRGKKPSKP